MLQLPLNQFALLLNEINKEINSKPYKYIEPLSIHLRTFKLYLNQEPLPTLIIYQCPNIIFLVNPTTVFIEEVIHIEESTRRIWCNTNGQILMHYRNCNKLMRQEDVKELRQRKGLKYYKGFPLLLW